MLYTKEMHQLVITALTVPRYINFTASDYFFTASGFKMNSLKGGTTMSYGLNRASLFPYGFPMPIPIPLHDLNRAPLFPYGFPMPIPIPLLFSHDNHY